MSDKIQIRMTRLVEQLLGYVDVPDLAPRRSRTGYTWHHSCGQITLCAKYPERDTTIAVIRYGFVDFTGPVTPAEAEACASVCRQLTAIVPEPKPYGQEETR